MSRIQGRGFIAGGAIVLALFSSSAADSRAAHEEIVVIVPSPKQPHHAPGPWVSGAKYDMANKALAEHKLQKLEAKFRSDAELGDAAATDHDARRINELRYRIAVDNFLIRELGQQDPGYYPRRIDETSLTAIHEAARPSEDIAAIQYYQTPAAPTISITIVNTEPAGKNLAFSINGMPHQATGGARQDLVVAPGSKITYDGGGSLGQHSYRITPGLYEFRSTPEGWALYKRPSMP